MTSPLRLPVALSDRYRIERELGAVGMATVYLAEDLKHKPKVALKVLKPELAAVSGAQRFVQERARDPGTPVRSRWRRRPGPGPHLPEADRCVSIR